MELFYIIVVSVALIVLIIFLTLVGLLMQNTSGTSNFPPVLNECPDYWTIGADNSCKMPVQTSFNNQSIILNTGNNKNGLILSDPKIAPYSIDGYSFSTKNPLWASKGETVMCAQKNWANSNNIVWDGVSNYNNC